MNTPLLTAGILLMALVLFLACMAGADSMQVPEGNPPDRADIQDIPAVSMQETPELPDGGIPPIQPETDTFTNFVRDGSRAGEISGIPTSAEITQILSTHQVYRGEIGAPPLVWSSAIATSAQAWAEHDASIGRMDHTPDDVRIYGENIEISESGASSWADIVDAWASEEANFVYGLFPAVSSTGDSRNVADYTQEIWYASIECGCGKATNTSQHADYFVCQYNPSGNIDGRYVYPLASSRDRVAVFLNGIWYEDKNGDGFFGTGDHMHSFGASGWTPVEGDWDGDTMTEIGVYSNGVWYLDMDGDGSFDSGDLRGNFGAAGWIPVVGDWDGDHTTEIGVSNNGVWYLDYDNDGKFDAGDAYYPGFGRVGWTPVVGNWDGDTATEIGVYSNGVWYLDYDNDGKFDAGDAYYPGFGGAGWTPVLGNWDGDSLTEIGVYSNGIWYLDFDSDGRYEAGEPRYNFGTNSWVPVVGNWDGDSYTEIGAFSNGVWYLDVCGNGAFGGGDITSSFGTTGWTPLAGKW